MREQLRITSRGDVFQTYIEQAASINAITRMFNERQLPTRKGIARWGRIDSVGDATQSGLRRASVTRSPPFDGFVDN
ncbi:MAG: hypothetical protein ACR2NN_10360 [Bryobacteraceae bacterium]